MPVGTWPEQDRFGLSLPADTTAPSAARQAARQALARWRLAPLADSVLLAVSELVTNAVRHGRPPVHLSMRCCGRRLSVAVADRDADRLPSDSMPGMSAEGGRGLAIVQAVATKTGSRRDPQGKVVWAEFDVEPARLEA